MKKYLTLVFIIFMTSFAMAGKNSLTGTFTTELTDSGIWQFLASYDADEAVLTIDVLSLDTDLKRVEVRIIAGIKGTDELILLKRTSVSMGSVIQIPLSPDRVRRYDKLCIELADSDKLGEGSAYTIGEMPGNNEANK